MLKRLLPAIVLSFIGLLAPVVWAVDAPGAAEQSKGVALGSVGFNDMLAKNIQPGVLTTVQQADGSFQLNNPIQTLQANVTSHGTTFTSTNKEQNKNGAFSVQIAQFGRDEHMQVAPTTDVYRDGDNVFHAHEGVTEKFSNTGNGIQQDFIVVVKPEGSGALQVQLTVADATLTTKDDGFTVALNNSQRTLTYDRLKVIDANNKTIPAHMQLLASNEISIVVDDSTAQYPLTIDPTVGDANWVSMSPAIDIVGGGDGLGQSGIVALVVDSSGNLYAGGYFTSVGGVANTAYIAKWSGGVWSALGTGISGGVTVTTFPSAYPGVWALALDSSGNLYAGGNFTLAGGVAVNNIAKWNGAAWSALGTGLDSYVTALVTASNGDLYVGGSFTAAGGVANTSHIAKWNGTVWSALSTGTDNTVNALAVDGSGNLYAGGQFTAAGGVANTGYIAKWNGTAWSALGTGVSSTVLAIVLDSGGNLYAGGFFALAGSVSVNRIAKWNGSVWTALGSGVSGGLDFVLELALDASGNLYAGGGFNTAGGVTTGRIAKWNGSVWSTLGTGIPGATVSAIVFRSNGNLIAGGQFTSAGGIAVQYIAAWNSAEWSALTSINASIHALAFDSSGNLYAGGDFTTIGGIAANYIAKWNGSVWSALGTGIAGANSIPPVSALLVDGSGNLYVGGEFNLAGGVTANRIAKWNGSVWSALGTGMLYGPVLALAMDTNGNLYAGGNFSTAGGVAVHNIAKWNGSAWSALGTGMNNNYVFSLVVDSSNNLYAGGDFTTAGGMTVNYIAKWNGSAWSALDSGVMYGGSYTGVYALALDSIGNLYAGGSFSTAGGIPATYNIAKWNGTVWSALSTGTNDDVYSLAVNGNGSLYAGGSFTTAGGVTASHIAKWDGTAWIALGTGVAGASPITRIDTIALDIGHNGNLYVGGEFTVAGGKVSGYMAKWLSTDNNITVITEPVAVAAYGGIFGVAATSSSGLTVTITTSGGCSVAAGIVTMTSGTTACAINFDQAGNASFNAATQIVRTTTATKASQTITVTTAPPASAAYNSTFPVAATSSSGLAVAITTSGGCTIAAGVVTMTSGTTACTVNFNQAGDINYNAATQVVRTTTATKASQTITVTTAAPATAINLSYFPVVATANSGLPVAITVLNANCMTADMPVTEIMMMVSSGICTVNFNQAGNANYNAAPQVQNFTTAIKTNQVITVTSPAPASAGYGSTFPVAANSDSGLTVAITVSGGCTIAAGTVTITSGTTACTVNYNQAGNVDYNAATLVSSTTTTGKGNQTITVTTAPPASAVYKGTFTVAATSSPSGLTVTYSTSGGCTIVGTTVTMSSGTTPCVVNYDQAGNANYNAAPQVQRTITATKAVQTITVTTAPPTSAAYNATFTVAATSNSLLPVTFSVSGGCTLAGAVVTMTSPSVTCTTNFDQAGDANYNAATQVVRTTTASKAAQTITVTTAPPASSGYGATFPVAATSNAGLVVAITTSGGCSVAAGIVTMTSAGTPCYVYFNQPGDVNYTAATQVSRSVLTGKGSQTITVTTAPPASAAVLSTFAIAANASSNLTVAITVSGGCTLAAGIVTMTSPVTTCTMNFNQAGDANYNVATQVVRTTTATKAAQTITVTTAAPAFASLSTTFPVAATASSGLTVAITVSGGCSIAGSTVTMTSQVTACTVNYNQAGNTNYNAATQVSSTTTASKFNQTITVTTAPPVSAVFNSTFPVAATASSALTVAITVSGGCSIAGGTVTMTSGTVACTVNFDQAGNTTYNAAPQVQNAVTANKAVQTITVSAPYAPPFAAVSDTFPVAATASSGLLVSITTSGGCTGAGGGGVTIIMTGATCTVNFNQAGDANYVAAPLVVNNITAPVSVFPLDGLFRGAGFNGYVQVQ